MRTKISVWLPRALVRGTLAARTWNRRRVMAWARRVLDGERFAPMVTLGIRRVPVLILVDGAEMAELEKARAALGQEGWDWLALAWVENK